MRRLILDAEDAGLTGEHKRADVERMRMLRDSQSRWQLARQYFFESVLPKCQLKLCSSHLILLEAAKIDMVAAPGRLPPPRPPLRAPRRMAL
jgi:hypothetical protein